MPVTTEKIPRTGKPNWPLCQEPGDSASFERPITKSWQAKFNFKKGNDLCATGIKE